jgi:hypothetical protein
MQVKSGRGSAWWSRSKAHGRARAEPAVWSDAELQALTRQERADLAHRLAALADPVFRDSAEVRRRRTRRFVNLLVLCCLVLTPWIGILALTLPVHYVASHWRGAWVGLDLALLIGLAT